MKWKIGLTTLAVIAAWGGFMSPAQAAVPRIPFECGMVVDHDATVYLAKDVTCKTSFGIRVQRPDADDAAPPRVTLDLKGKTLRGTATGTGVRAYDWPFIMPVTVRNGTIKGWGTGVVGSDGLRVQLVSFVGNTMGMACGGEDCAADRSTFLSNRTGFNVYADAGGSVTRSTFIGNRRGAVTLAFSRLTIDQSNFFGNDVGASADYRVIVSRTAFVKNRIALLMEQYAGGYGCADLTKVTFKVNGRDLVGGRC
jgi:hypothetical protein